MKRPGRKLLWLTVFLTFDLIMFGAFVRITDSGLGCPDWPGCYGKLTPLGAIETIRAEAEVRPDGPVTVFKAWVEMLHRYVAAFLGLLIILIAGLATREARARRRLADAAQAQGPTAYPGALAPGLAWFTVFWVVLQGVFGAWTVTLQLKPIIVTAHLMGGMILFGLLLAQAARLMQPVALSPSELAWRPIIRVGLALLVLQIALGGWVSTNYATLACQDFPRCQGSWWPPMEFAAAFELWRPLGMTADGQGLPFQALTAIHYTHRLMAYAVFALLGWTAWRMRAHPGLFGFARALIALLLLQFLTGLTNILMGWPLAAAVLHTGGAAALLGVLLMLEFQLSRGATRSEFRALQPASLRS